MGAIMSRAERRQIQEEQRRLKALSNMGENACELVIVRHGETDWNVEHRLQGQLHPGPSLNPNGVKQAHALAERLENEHFDAIYSSTLIRTIETADIIQKYHQNLELQSLSDLRERCLACLEGLTMAEAYVKFPAICQGLGATANESSEQAGVESLDAMLTRVASALEHIAASHSRQRVLVIVHGGVLHAVHRRATGTSPAGKSSNCAINELKIDSSKKPALWAVVRWGDAEHLEEGSSDAFGGGNVG